MPFPNDGVPKNTEARPRTPSPHPKKLLRLQIPPKLHREEAFHTPPNYDEKAGPQHNNKEKA